ncbi:putative positive regulation of inhibitory postsynaptic [Homalodisca vitripennis]|nr:putative positive regulation of inhibitory postsynaptic [Homalodisca vitripennis]
MSVACKRRCWNNFIVVLCALHYSHVCLFVQVIWVCILCRKKQELLSKTGQWINKGMAAGDPIMRRIEADLQQQQSDKRPKLERAHSAAEKENQPLVQRSGSVLRRQYSQQDPTREEEARYYRGELEGLMRTHQYGGPRNDSLSSEQSSSMDCAPANRGGVTTVLVPGSKKHKRSGSAKKQSGAGGTGGQRYHQPQQPQRSFSSSEDELRSTPDCTSCEEHDSEKGDTDTIGGDERLKKQAILDEKIKKFLAVRGTNIVEVTGGSVLLDVA